MADRNKVDERNGIQTLLMLLRSLLSNKEECSDEVKTIANSLHVAIFFFLVFSDIGRNEVDEHDGYYVLCYPVQRRTWTK